jgi:hypothetical protein
LGGAEACYFDDERMLLVMHRLKLVGLVVLAVFAVAVGVAASASAATTMTLPEFVTKTSWKGSSGAGILRASGVEIKCTTGTNTGGIEATKKLGTFALLFLGCSSLLTATECKTEGTTGTGNILTVGTWHLVLTTKAAADQRLIWFLVQEFVTKCGTVSITTKGNVLGEITPGNVLTKHYALKVLAPLGVQEITTFENDSGELVSASLLSSAGVGFHVATEESAENKIETALDTLIIN